MALISVNQKRTGIHFFIKKHINIILRNFKSNLEPQFMYNGLQKEP